MRRDLLPLITIAERQAFKQQLHYRLRKPPSRGGCCFEHVFTAPDQMTQAGLVKRMNKTIVGPPAVMVQESAVICTEYRSGLSKSTSGQNRIKGDFGADTNPEPLQMCGDSPARLIEPIHQTVTDGNLKFLIRGFGFLSQSRHRAAKRAAADSEAVAPFQDLSGTLV